LDAWCSSSEAIAVARIFTSAFFLLFGEYKVFGSEFTHRGFQQYLQGFIQNGAVSSDRGRQDHVGTAALGCPAERSSAYSFQAMNCRAALDRTAGGGCPHVVLD